MNQVKLEEDMQSYFNGNRLMGIIEGLPRASTGAIQIPPSELLKAASWSSQIMELYTKEVFSLNPAFKYTLSDYFQCFKRSLKLVMSTKEEKQEKDNEGEQIKLMMFLMMTGLPKFDYELYGFKCQTTQTPNFSHTSKESVEEEDNENEEEDEYSNEEHDKNEEGPKRVKNQRLLTEKTEKDSPSEDRSSEKSSHNEQRSKLIRKPGRPKKRKYYFSKKTE